ncbi:MAG TPA: glycosyltransferase [Planctomycetia bacterium]|nr:glycosyltransferase [Planctomycetia bacterium]
MRILVVAQHYWPSVGGAETVLRRLTRSWVAAGESVEVWTGRWDETLLAEENDSGVRILRHPVTRVRWLGTVLYVRLLARMLAERGREFDVVYVSMLKHAAWACVTACRKVGIPVVLRPEGAGATGDAVWQDKAWLGGSIRAACREAADLVTLSEEIETELLARGYPAERLHRIPNGTPIPELPWSRAAAPAARARRGLPDAPLAVYTGRLHPGKGLGDLVEAIGLLAAKGSNWRAALVGEGPARAELETLAREKGVADRIALPGAVAEVEDWLRAAEAFVLPSYYEGLSIALLEALALGVPCLVSDIPANRSVLQAEWLPTFPPRNPAALAAALESLPTRTHDVDGQRRETAARYDVAIAARRHLERFASLRAPKTGGSQSSAGGAAPK